MAPPKTDRVAAFWAGVAKSDGCWLWVKGCWSDGYGRFYDGQHGTQCIGAHVFSYRLHFGELAEGLKVLHRCDVKPCVRPDHLFAGTTADNQIDMMLKGRSTRGSRSYRARLTEAQVLEIKQRSQEPTRVLAAEYGVTPGSIHNIRVGLTWGWLISGEGP